MFDGYRYKYFALRDRLALLVINGTIKENSFEYKFLIDAINYHINTIETVSMIRVIELLIKYHNSPDESRSVSLIAKKVDNKDALSVVLDFMKLSNDLLYRNSRAQMRILNFIFNYLPLKKLENKIILKDGNMRQIKKTSDKINSNIKRINTALGNNHALAV
jgi:hypothetical protein